MQNKSISSSAEKLAGSTDILCEILFRLPLKPLLRLKSVSKQWRALISDHRFLESHFHRRRQSYPTSLIFPDYYFRTRIFSFTAATGTLGVLNLDFLNEPKVAVVRSCNGLLLCRPTRINSSTYFICNPKTRDFTTLNLPHHLFSDQKIEFFLAFDPWISPHYKVIAVSMFQWSFILYSSETRSWIGPRDFDSVPFEMNVNGVYCNRAIHWCTRNEFSVYFNVDTLCLKNYPMPLSRSEMANRKISCFGESGGRLHLMLTAIPRHRDRRHIYEIFELNEDYSGWSLRHRIDLDHVEFSKRYPCTLSCWFYIVRTAKEEKSMLVLFVGYEEAFSYDPVDQTLRKLFHSETVMRIASHFGGLFQYFESTAHVEACTGAINPVKDAANKL